MESVGGWFVEERKITREDWDKFEQRYLGDLGFESEPDRTFWADTQLFQEVPAFRRETSNWAQLMPTDSARRLEIAATPYDTFKEIVEETTANALGKSDIGPSDLYYCATHVMDRFRGNVDFRALSAGDVSSSETSRGSTHEGMTVVVTSVNERNLEDWYVYDIEDGEEVFGPEMGSATYTAHYIQEAGLEPDRVVRDVALVLRTTIDPSVDGVTPPDHPVSIPYQNSYIEAYYEVENPIATFGDAWGDTEKMYEILLDSSAEIHDIGIAPPWWVTSGANW